MRAYLYHQELNSKKNSKQIFESLLPTSDFLFIFFDGHSRFTGHQGKDEAISLTLLYHFHPLRRHLGISRAITAGSSPPHIASSRTRTGKFSLVSDGKSLTANPSVIWNSVCPLTSWFCFMSFPWLRCLLDKLLAKSLNLSFIHFKRKRKNI